MKRQHRCKEVYAAITKRKEFLSFTRKGLGIAAFSALLLAGTVQRASATQIISSARFDAALGDMVGYVVAPFDPNSPDRQMVIAGNVRQAGNPYVVTDAIHYGWADQNGGVMAGMVYRFPEYIDVRAVAIDHVDFAGESIILIQGRDYNFNSHMLAIRIDAMGNIFDQYDIPTMGQPGAISFPLHAIVSNNQLYVCGYQQNQTINPLDPAFYESREAYVTRVDLNTHQALTRFFNTPQAGNGANDYDAAMRLKEIYGAIYVMGSGNGHTNTPAGVMNASKSWVAQIDANTMAVNIGNYFGNSTETNTDPNALMGTYAIDMVPDHQVDFYLVASNDLGKNRWVTSRTYLNLTTAPSFNGFNTFTTVQPGNRMKASQIFMQDNGQLGMGRYTICGIVGNNISLNNNAAYGTDIEYISNGAVPFVQSYDVNYFTTAPVYNIKGTVLGNAPGYSTNMAFNQPFTTMNNMGEWCNPAFAMRSAEQNTTPYNNDLMMAGHVRSWGTAGPVNFRFMGTSGEGAVNGCPAAQYMADVQATYFNMTSVTVNPATVLAYSWASDINIDAQVTVPLVQWDCAPGFIYREAKPGSLTNGTQAPGLYPNPATDRVTIVLGSDAAANAPTRVVMTDVTGRVVFTHQAVSAGSSMELNLPRLTPGMYQMAVSVANGQPTIHKLVIQ